MSRLLDAVTRKTQRAAAGARLALRSVLASVIRTTKIQLVSGEGLAGEQLDRLELFQHFGFTSAPPKGTQGIVLPLGGRSSAAVVISTEHGSYRFQLLADGEACVYNQWGDFVHLRQDRTIHVVSQAKVLIETDQVEVNAATRAVVNTLAATINADDTVEINTAELTINASAGVHINTPAVACSANITAGANITAAGEVADAGGAKTMSGMRATYDAHDHNEHDNAPAPTSTPNLPM